MARMPKTAVTIQHIADRAGVSKSAVAAVVNGSRSGTRVSDATRERIVATAAELGYSPNVIARSLRHRTTSTIGYYSGFPLINPNTPFQAELITGLQAGCEEHRKDLLLHGKYQGKSSQDVYSQLANGKIDGLVLFSPTDDDLVRLLTDSHLPVVAVADALPSLPSVVVDDADGGRLQAEHLYAKGHRYILYRTVGVRPILSAVRRHQAFRRTAIALGMTVLDSPGQGRDGERFTEDEKDLLRSRKGPTAIVAWQDGAAVHLMEQCLELGLRVPDDIAVVGFDGVPPPVCIHVAPRWKLTTIHAPWQNVAYTAVSLLIDQAEGKEVPPETVLPVQMREGNTT